MDYFFVFFGCGIPYKWDFIALWVDYTARQKRKGFYAAFGSTVLTFACETSNVKLKNQLLIVHFKHRGFEFETMVFLTKKCHGFGG